MHARALVPAGLLLVALLVAPAVAFPCPPVGFDSVHNLDLGKYLTGTWYVQLQVRGDD